MNELQNSDEDNMRVAFSLHGKPDLRLVAKSQPLQSLIRELVERHNIEGSGDDYCLVFETGSNNRDYCIVTEKNRAEMNAKYGNVIILSDSPGKSASRILRALVAGGNVEELSQAIADLELMAGDSTFALEFFSRKGMDSVMQLLVVSCLSTEDTVSLLHSVVLLMEHEIVSMDELVVDAEFIGQLARFINAPLTDPPILLHCLHILVMAVLGTTGSSSAQTDSGIVGGTSGAIVASVTKPSSAAYKIDRLERQLALSNLVTLLAKNNSEIQLASLKLINALLRSVGVERRTDMVRMLSEKPSRTIIKDHLLLLADGVGMPGEEKWSELNYELYLLQYYILQRQVYDRMITPIRPDDTLALQKIKDMRTTAFDMANEADAAGPTSAAVAALVVAGNLVKHSSTPHTRYAQDYKKLGFTSEKDPSMDFKQVPPGVLALDCMDYFAKHHPDQFTRLVLENSCRSDGHACPFAAASVELVKLLGQILGVGRPPLTPSQGSRFYEMFFKCEYPFEEFYTHCIVILNKTWREMRATREDFRKVLDVVREQIENALQCRITCGPKTFEEFKNKVRSYTDISKKWQKDANTDDPWRESEPVKVLKEHLTHEIVELIQQQRYNFMVEGTKFHRLKKNGEVMKGQYRYIKLHTNHKTIYVGDWSSDKTVPTIEDLEPKVQVLDIKDIVVGSTCPFLKEFGPKVVPELQKTAFSVLSESSSGGCTTVSLDCVAPDEQTFNYWTDGLATLLGRPMISADFVREREILLGMAVKLRLLELEGLTLPQTAPEVPPPPPNLNFSSASTSAAS